MKYAVIICPKCGKARGVETARKTTTCQCSRVIKVPHTKSIFETDSPSELARAVAEANEQLAEGSRPRARRKRSPKDPYAGVAERARAIRDPLERMRVVAQELTVMNGEFGYDDVRRVASMVGKESPEDIIARLQEHGLIYETSEGTYRAV
jgi:secreted Zn-dependent insulinase-like peptidase